MGKYLDYSGKFPEYLGKLLDYLGTHRRKCLCGLKKLYPIKDLFFLSLPSFGLKKCSQSKWRPFFFGLHLILGGKTVSNLCIWAKKNLCNCGSPPQIVAVSYGYGFRTKNLWVWTENALNSWWRPFFLIFNLLLNRKSTQFLVKTFFFLVFTYFILL